MIVELLDLCYFGTKIYPQGDSRAAFSLVVCFRKMSPVVVSISSGFNSNLVQKRSVQQHLLLSRQVLNMVF